MVFDTSDWRSVIENGLFKEGKHPWHLGRFPKKSEAAVIVHCPFTLLVMALCTAFRLWQVKLALAHRLRGHRPLALTPQRGKS